MSELTLDVVFGTLSALGLWILQGIKKKS
jgi:hypothetical protein